MRCYIQGCLRGRGKKTPKNLKDTFYMQCGKTGAPGVHELIFSPTIEGTFSHTQECLEGTQSHFLACREPIGHCTLLSPLRALHHVFSACRGTFVGHCITIFLKEGHPRGHFMVFHHVTEPQRALRHDSLHVGEPYRVLHLVLSAGRAPERAVHVFLHVATAYMAQHHASLYIGKPLKALHDVFLHAREPTRHYILLLHWKGTIESTASYLLRHKETLEGTAS